MNVIYIFMLYSNMIILIGPLLPPQINRKNSLLEISLFKKKFIAY